MICGQHDASHPDFERFGEKFGDEHEHHFHTVDPDVVARAATQAGMTLVFAGHDHIAGRPAVVVEATKPS